MCRWLLGPCMSKYTPSLGDHVRHTAGATWSGVVRGVDHGDKVAMVMIDHKCTSVWVSWVHLAPLDDGVC